ncbi:hypothetical protein [uncultured Microbulbifer sp.]|uniref:Acb2/Tad1 domain-containing protein n=1 Tax=uncultured Microbulbifer sp. TaxID=348147 RepID=UPI0026116891|nr:hypothetical protein [uncultured Microbulbifer sp.]
MENQHRKIKGYRELSEEEVALMNEAKDLAEKCGALIEKLWSHPDTNKRCISLGKTNLQQGFMWAVRGVARPETF